MNTAAVSKSKYSRLRCPDCGAKDQFSASFEEKNVPEHCAAFRVHFNHEFAYDHLCAVCIARGWLSRLRAIRVLFFHPGLLAAEDPR
jgi:hypothetical protein